MTFPTPTADQLSRGSKFWSNQYHRGQGILSRTDWDKTGWDKAQEFADKVSQCQHIARNCKTYWPCSRTYYL